MVFVIKLSDLVIQIKTVHDKFYLNFRDYIYKLQPQEEPDLHIEITPSDITNEKCYLNSLSHDNISTNFSKSELHAESLAVYRKIANLMPFYNTLLMHGVVLENDGKGFLIVASSGVGKTTRAKIWQNVYPDTRIINGDKPLIKITKNAVLAYGTPWCGKESYNINQSVPLCAIFLLERAENHNIDEIEELCFSKAFPVLLQQTHLPDDTKTMSCTLRLLKELGRKVKVYKFISSPTPKSIRLAYETAIKQDGTQG